MLEPIQEWKDKVTYLNKFTKGKTIDRIIARPFCHGLEGANESLLIVFTDTTAIIVSASSYAIPEESCLYVETSI